MDSVKLITQSNPKSPVSEAFRTLRTNLQFSSIDKEIKVIVVTSSTPGEGKTTVSANLATSIAMGNKKVLLVDCDLRKPKVHQTFGITNVEGLTNILMGEKRLIDVEFRGSDESATLSVLASGPIPPNPAELLSSKRMIDFLDDVRFEYDMVILDSPPIGLVTDSAILSTKADGTILVVAAGKTDIEATKRSKGLLDKVNANVIGVVLNKIPIKGRGSYKYSYYQYDTYYGEDESLTKRKKRRAK